MPIILPSGGGGSGIGALLFSSTLGVAAPSIDTGANGVAGSQTILEVFIVARTDEAAAAGTLDIVVNNDSSAIYDLVQTRTTNAAVTGGNAPGLTRWQILVAGNTNDAGVFGIYTFRFPNYADASFHKFGEGGGGFAATTAANNINQWQSLRYRSNTAITRFAISEGGAGTNLMAGSRLLIYGR